MVVTWTTFNITDSLVEYGTNSLTNIVKGKMTTFYDKGDSNRTWFIHRVTIENLKPGLKYSEYLPGISVSIYIICSENANFSSHQFSSRL